MADRSHTSRLAAYKNAGQGTPTELRRKRAELSITLRKQARDEQLLKRRITSPEPSEPQEAEKSMTPAEIVQGLKSNDVIIMSAAARAARRMLSREQNPPISSMLEAGVLKPLVSALDRDDCEDLQFEAAWAITNIASGTHEQTVAVIDSGALPKLVLLLSRGGPLGEQSAWALGNVAGDGAQPRDVVLAQGALPALLPMLTRATALSQLKTAVWAYSNFCRHKNPLVNFDLVAPALPYLTELLTHSEPDVLVDICWALSYLTDGPNERIEQVQTTQHLLPRLVNLLQHKSPIVLTPALRATGNMLTGSDLQTDRCLEAGCLEHLAALLRCGRAALVKEAAWAASNVLAGTQAQIQAAVDAGLLNHLVHVLHTGDIKSKKEAAWGITNLTMGGTPAQLDALMSAGFLEPYCGLLESTDLRAIVVVLDGISNLLQAADKFGQVEPLCIALEEIQVLGVIENLQNHPNDEIYQKSAALISTYFSDPDDLAAQPDGNDDEFQFTASQDNQNIRF